MVVNLLPLCFNEKDTSLRLTQAEDEFPMTKLDSEIVDKFREALKISNKQPATIDSYGRDAQDFVGFLDQHQIALNQIEPQTMLWFRDHLRDIQGERENSIRRKVIGVRQFFRFLAEDRVILNSPFDVVPLPERDDSFDDALDPMQLEALLAVLPEKGLKNLRDRAILHMLALEGVKATELISLLWRNAISSSSAQTLTIQGQRSRTIILQEESFESLAAYARAFTSWLQLQEDSSQKRFEWIFVAFKGKDQPLVLPQMTRHGLKFMLHELGQKIGLTHLHTESLRHYAMNFQINAGRSPEEIMHHLGLRRIGNIGRHLGRKRDES